MPSMHQTALAGLHLSRALLRRLVDTNKMSKADAAAVWDEAIATCHDEGQAVLDRQEVCRHMAQYRKADLK
jgi:hypothetical protein